MSQLVSPEAVLDIYREYGAEWRFDYRGNPEAPHAKLSGGSCTDVYWNSDLVLSNPGTTTAFATLLIDLLRKRNAVLPVDWVVGSAYGAITFSFEVARQLEARHGFTRQDPEDPKRQIWQGTVIPGGATVLGCEDVITSFGSVYAVRKAIETGNPDPVRFLPDVAAIIWRPRQLATAVTDVTALVVALATNVWPQEECPLCKQGSPRLRPKAHWRELTGK